MTTPESHAPEPTRPALRLGILLDRVAADLAARQRFPEATYRVQFHAGFTFRDARALVPYLHALGITHLYASPYLKARPGSQHGYDISDHQLLNPEIGSADEYNAWVDELHAHGMGQILDVVPNHMGIVGNQNAWWNDILENGPASTYANFFDIDWYSSFKPELRERVLLPVLGDNYGKVLEAQQLQLQFQEGSFAIFYFEHRFPVSPCTYDRILEHELPELEQALGRGALPFLEYQSIVTAIKHLPRRNERDTARVAERLREKEVIKRRLATLAADVPAVQAFIARNVERFNGRGGDPRSFDLLDALLDAQAYRLCFWRVAADEINYRRFFDVNELAALSMERPEVFAATHQLVLQLLRERKIDGLRIDHPDGLYDPHEYLQRLQRHYVLDCVRAAHEARPEGAATWEEMEAPLREEIKVRQQRGEAWLQRPLYVLAEKILGKGEPIPEDWPVHGTTGYEFLNTLNGLFVEPGNATTFQRLYQRWLGPNGQGKWAASFADIVYQKKFLILQVSLSSELHMLAHQLDRLSERDRWSRDFTLNSLRHALREIIACFPVYRSYITTEGIHTRDRFYVESAVARAKRKNPAISASLFDFVRDTLLLRPPPSAADVRAEQCRFAGKFQQVTAPVMAKGLEDTAFYVYNRLLSLNEVGGDPERFGVSPASFHHQNQDRQVRWPRALSATATHDSKRGEDVRARLNVLSEIPGEWQQALRRWHRFNKKHRTQLEDQVVPDRNDEYFLYQTLVGAWPLEPLSPEEFALFVERIQAYVEKAFHEAKVHTSWVNTNPAFDDAAHQFVGRILDGRLNRRFLDDMRAFQQRISHVGLFNSLSQAVLKMTSPGVPDTYQGTELWDFTLVDPDNRRPVDYGRRRQMLHDLEERASAGENGLAELACELTANKEDGRIKLFVMQRTLRCRRDHAGLFSVGEYLPAETSGAHCDNVCAFVRRWEGRCAVVAAPRLLTRLLPEAGQAPLGDVVWGDTLLLLPGVRLGQSLRNLYTGEILTPAPAQGLAALPAAEVFRRFPVALLLAQE
jgi:(1->4)-alpha-D-glucan 1-alpha-D-glucosylmutase